MHERALESVRLPESIPLITLIRGFVIAAALAAVVHLAWTAYWWKQYADQRFWQIAESQKQYDAMYQFLANGLPAGPDGKVYNRSQVLDALVQQALKNLQQQQAARPTAPTAAPPVKK